MVEDSLDPADWTELRTLGHRMLDDMLDWLEHVRARPVWQPFPESARQALRRPLPRAPEGAGPAYEDFRRHVLPYPMGNVHPRFWAWVIGTGTPLGALAEMLAATMNPNMGGGEHAPNHVEAQVLDWCKEMLGYPMSASGLLVSGGSMANLVGLAVARHACAGVDIRRGGVRAAGGPLTVYGSRETHSSVQKAVELLGLGSEVPEYADPTRAMARADSIAFDLHKWMYMPFGAGCVLVRDAESHRRAFSIFPDYLARSTRGVAGGELWFSEYGVQLSRGYRALKMWMSLKEHGVDRYARLVRQNIDQARYLADLVGAAPDLELMAPVPLNVVCFRWVGARGGGGGGGGAEFDGETLDALNQELLLRLHEGGIAVPSNALLGGRYALRVAITNHRSRREDFELLAREVSRLGAELAQASRT